MASRALRAAIVLALLSSLAGCAGGAGTLSGPPPQRGGQPVTYVALGEPLPSVDSDPRLQWQDLFAHVALPYWATSYELNLPDGWGADPGAIASEVSALHPTVVSVDVGADEVISGSSVEDYSASLTGLLSALRVLRAGTILVADLPPVPGPFALLVAEYNSAIATDAAAAGAVLVNVHSVVASALSAGHRVMESGNALTPLGESLVADAFEKAAEHISLTRTGRHALGKPPERVDDP